MSGDVHDLNEFLAESEHEESRLTKREYFAAHAPITYFDAKDALEISALEAGWKSEQSTSEIVMEKLIQMRTTYADLQIAKLKVTES